mgnify:CR=1 FL=1
MPGAVARTAAFALNNATLPFVLTLAGQGLHRALEENTHLLNGLNVHAGQTTYEAVALATDNPYTEPAAAIGLR